MNNDILIIFILLFIFVVFLIFTIFVFASSHSSLISSKNTKKEIYFSAPRVSTREQEILLNWSYDIEGTGRAANELIFVLNAIAPGSEETQEYLVLYKNSQNIFTDNILKYDNPVLSDEENTFLYASDLSEVFDKNQNVPGIYRFTLAAAIVDEEEKIEVQSEFTGEIAYEYDGPFIPFIKATTSLLLSFVANNEVSGTTMFFGVGLNQTYKKTYRNATSLFYVATGPCKVVRMSMWEASGLPYQISNENEGINTAYVGVNNELTDMSCSYPCDGFSEPRAETTPGDEVSLVAGDQLIVIFNPQYDKSQSENISFFFEIILSYGDDSS